MDQETSELHPKGEIPTEAEFARLLCDKTFVDYFNVFLSLPVFAQRILYRFSDQSFELDPPVKRTEYRLDRVKLMRWVRRKRAPWFFKSDLYIEYLLCKHLQKTQLHIIFNYGTDSSSSKEKIIDHFLMERWLKGVSGMRRFNRFIASTAGSSSVHFWLDMERQQKTMTANQNGGENEEDKWTTFFQRMEAKYLRSRELKLHGLEKFYRMKQAASCKDRSSSGSSLVAASAAVQGVNRKTYIIIQGYILKQLQNYWVPRYLVHCKQQFSRYLQMPTFKVYRPDCYAVKVRSLSDVADEPEGDEEKRGRRGSEGRSLDQSIRKLHMLKQSVGNLISMFSSSRVRCAELATLRNVEDTGVQARETEVDEVIGGTNGDDKRSKSPAWMAEEFPLPVISEESLTYPKSSSVSPTKTTPSFPPSPVVSSVSPTKATPNLLHSPEKLRSVSSESLPEHADDEMEGQQSDEESTRKVRRSSRHSSRHSSANRSMSPHVDLATPGDSPDSPLPLSLQASPEKRAEDDKTSSPLGSERRSSSSRRGSTKSRTPRRSPSSRGSGPTEEEQAASPRDANKVQKVNISESSSDQESSSSESPAEDLHAEKKTESPVDVGKQEQLSKVHTRTEDVSDTTVTQTESGEGTTDKGEKEGKHKGTIADLMKYRRNSDTLKSASQDSSSTSVGHSSVSSGSLASLSKRRMSVQAGQSTAQRPQAGAAKPPTKRRSRSQSVEFRLGDFSLLLDKSGQAKKENTSIKKTSSDKIKLEADLIALRNLQQERAKRKKERLRQIKAMKKKAKAARKKKEKTLDIEEPCLIEMEDGDEAGNLVNTLKKLALRRRGTINPMAKVKGSALQKLLTLHNKSISDGQKHDKVSQEQDGKRYMNTTQKRHYWELSFEEKLLVDDNRLEIVAKLSDRLGIQYPEVSPSNRLMPILQPGEQPAGTQTHSETFHITRPRFFSYNLGDPKYRWKNKLLVNAVISDKLAGGPWVKFMSRFGYTNEVRYLRFWHAARKYIIIGVRRKGPEDDWQRKRVAIEIMRDFLKPVGEPPIQVGDLLTAELSKQLSINNGDELLLHAQDLACEALKSAWKVYQQHDVESFLGRVGKKKNAQQRSFNPAPFTSSVPSPTPDAFNEKQKKTLADVLAEARKGAPNPDGDQAGGRAPVPRPPAPTEEGLISSVAPHRMFRAVKLCLGASCLEWSDSDASEPSDPEEESDDEGSLRKRNVIVFRKKKIKPPPALPVPKKEVTTTRVSAGEQARMKRQMVSVLQDWRERQETSKTGVCKVIRKGGKTIYRPSRPRSFMEVLHDSSHFEFFKRFLQVEVGNDLPLLFWQDVEQLRMGNVRDPKIRQAKAQAIVKKFFNKSTNNGDDLDTDADIIRDIPNMEKVTRQMLMSAQTCVAKSMEEKMFPKYKKSYAKDSPEENGEESRAQFQFAKGGRTKYLWSMFISNVCNFRRLLMTPWLLSLFKHYLGKEVEREVERQKITGVINKRIIGGRVVIVDKLRNDLCFWAEVERFKVLVDNAARASAAGIYTLEDEEFVQKKALAIIDVFLDSYVPPRVQINVPQEIAEDIVDNAQHGIIERGLFHYASLHTFTVLLYCWKKFTKERLSYKAVPGQDVEELLISDPPFPISVPTKGRFQKKPSTPRVCGVKIKTLVGSKADDHPRMLYTIEKGVQLILPPKPPPDLESKDHIRNLIRTLISAGHEDSLLELFQQHAGLGLGNAEQRRLSRSKGLAFPPLLKQQDST